MVHHDHPIPPMSLDTRGVWIVVGIMSFSLGHSASILTTVLVSDRSAQAAGSGLQA